MPTFNDPHADAREAAEAIRGLAHATHHIEDPEVLHPIIGEMLAVTRRLTQVFNQLAAAHQRLSARAATDDGDRAAGAELAAEAATALKEVSGHVGQGDTVLDRALNRAGRIAWQPETPPSRWVSVVFLQGQEADPVLDIIDRQGTDAAIEYLAGWDQGEDTVNDAMENGYVYDTPPQTPADRVATRDTYALTYSPSLGYAGLSRQIDATPDPALLDIDAPAAPGPAGRHRGHDRFEGSWFRHDGIAEVAEARGLYR